MKTNISNAVKEYQKKYYFCKNAGGFYASDIMQVIDIAGGISHPDMFLLVETALEAGFIRGYKRARRDIKKEK